MNIRSSSGPVAMRPRGQWLGPFVLASAALCLGLIGISGVAAARDGGVDLIVVNADIRTSDPARPAAQAFAVTDGKFVAVGTKEDIRQLAGDDTEVIDAGGASVLPGFIDGHTHIGGGADLVNGVDLYGIPDKKVWLRMIGERSAQLPAGEWLVGGRWDYTLAEGELPTREDIDSVVPDRPVALDDVDGHSTWVNSKAMELLGITRDTPVPEGGEIVLDPATGEPTGILKEGAARLISQSGLLTRSDAKRRADLRQTVKFVNSMGITSAHDMGDLAGLYDYLSLLEADALTLRVWYGVFADGTGTKAPDYARMRDEIRARTAQKMVAKSEGPLLEFGYFKTVIDGVLSTHTAVMLAPYSDRPEVTGVPFSSQDHFTEFVRAGNENGFPVAIHAIGDRAINMALNAFEAGARPLALQNRIEHIEVIAPGDVRRFADLKVAASMQPNHATGTIGKYITERIGPERERYAYVWKDMLKAGVHLVFGSDWATSPLSPLVQISDAVFRESPTGLGDGTWYPANAVTFDEALRAFTQAGADMTDWADQIGSISVGKWADFVVLSGTLPEPFDRSFRELKVDATFVAGRRVYGN